MRCDGILFKRIKCSGFKGVLELPLYFSFKAVKVSDKEMVACSFLPAGIERLLGGREFLILESSTGSHFNVVRAYAQEVEGRKFKITLEEESSEDRRLFKRFSFCPEEVGEFLLQKEGKTIRRVYIIDMNLKGVKLILKGHRRGIVGRGEFLTLIQGKKILTVKVLWDEEEKDGLMIGGQVLKANFNIMKFIMYNYVTYVKRLLSQNV